MSEYPVEKIGLVVIRDRTYRFDPPVVESDAMKRITLGLVKPEEDSDG